ncbi:MAG: flagellar biosynthetic protein FliO [Fidelibacterota bacterium]|nr:MAG: flagellar biosynthetic protein FliO [Candidatus Neomarinimicrobiota bacterium]
MARKDARRFTNLILIMVMVMVAIIGISLQSRSIETRTQKPRTESTVEAPADQPVEQHPEAAEELAQRPESTVGNNLTLTLWKVILYVALIIAAIIIGARILRRYGGDRLRQASSPDIRILGRRYISPKQSIAMVKVRHKELLLGITDHSIRLLYDFTPEEEEDGTEFA